MSTVRGHMDRFFWISKLKLVRKILELLMYFDVGKCFGEIFTLILLMQNEFKLPLFEKNFIEAQLYIQRLCTVNES